MDAADIASELATAEREAGIARRKRYTGESATECECCGERIAEARRVALPGVTVCVVCQTAAEGGG